MIRIVKVWNVRVVGRSYSLSFFRERFFSFGVRLGVLNIFSSFRGFVNSSYE